MTRRKLFWAVFDEFGTIWLCSIKRTRASAIESWLKDCGLSGDASQWIYWRRHGYSVDRISIKRG